MKTKLFIILFIILITSRAFSQGTISSIQNVTTGSIPQFEKFEVGISLTKTFINPYDTDEISVEANFISPSNQSYTVYGFYYQDFQRTSSPPFWNPISTTYPWRIRFSPNESGIWHYTIKINENNGSTTSISNDYTFTCNSSSNPGYLKISSNKRYLEFSNGSSFFGIGQDMEAYLGKTAATPTQCSSGVYSCSIECFNEYVLPEYKRWIDNFAQNGGNLIRVWLYTHNFELEWEQLGNYEQRQNRAYDLDSIFEYAKLKNIYIHLVLMSPTEFQPESDIYGWSANPYRNTLNLNNRVDFFNNNDAKKYFKKKLRYIHARYGYSTTLANYEILNEMDWVTRHSNEEYGPNYSSFKGWYNEMASYLKSMYPKPLTNTSFAIYYSGELGDLPGDLKGINYLNTMDFTNIHYYSYDINVEY